MTMTFDDGLFPWLSPLHRATLGSRHEGREEGTVVPLSGGWSTTTTLTGHDSSTADERLATPVDDGNPVLCVCVCVGCLFLVEKWRGEDETTNESIHIEQTPTDRRQSKILLTPDVEFA